MIKKRRRLEAKTDYLARKTFLISPTRIIFRKTNKYVIGQYVHSKEAQDSVIVGITSKELESFGWPKSENIKSIPASYLTGYLLGKKIMDKNEKASAILDIGLNRNIHGSKIYAFLKGVIDSGVNIKGKPEIFPKEERILGKHLKTHIDTHKIKSAIEKKFA